MNNKFAVLILSHGRADRIYTIEALRKGGYTGKIYIVVDDEDEQRGDYIRLYGDSVVTFSKKDMEGTFDKGDNLKDRRVIVYARNKCHDIARNLGLDYFLELEDDYTSFEFRVPKNGKLLVTKCKQLDRLFADMVEFLEVSGALTVALAQGGDFIGGYNGSFAYKGLARKAMNSFFCKTDRPFKFYGRINEDVNTYAVLNQRGKKIFTFTGASIVQKQTQSNAGGMTGIYQDMGTYYKSFFSVMYAPSCVKISVMGSFHKRIHHNIIWSKCSPKILNERWKK